MDLTLLTVSFNNNILTGLMCKSFIKQTGTKFPTVIVDNGTTLPVDDKLKSVFTVVDNFNHKLLPDEYQNSRNHCAAIDYAIYNAVHTKWCLLVDNDILFLPAVKALLYWAENHNSDVYGEVGYDMTPPDRLLPYFCLINADKMKTDGIRYFDRCRITKYHMRNQMGNVLYTDPIYNVQDTGYSFYQDVKSHHWKIMDFPISKVCVHYKEGSAGGNRLYEWFNKYSALF